MDDSAWARAKELLAEAAERPPAERERFVCERCSDPGLRREILALLASPAPLSEIVTRAALHIGSRLGPYRIEALAGRGGMGEVYRARDVRLGRDVAVKVLPASFAGNPELLARFEREGRLLASINHPHICALFDIGEQDGTPFLVMEYVDGEPLSDRLTRGPLPVGQAVRRAIEIADALAKAHARGIVHRDLKPGNIMLTAPGAKLLDFGLARPGTPVGAGSAGAQVGGAAGAGLTREGTLLGTWRYMAPEQLDGREADPRSDLWAFGCVLYEMLTGRPAFEGDSQPRMIASIVERTPPPPSAVRTAVAPALDHIVARCLAKDPDERWQSAADLRHELEWVASSSDQPADSPPLSKRSWRKRIAWGLASLAAMVAASAVTVAVAGRRAEPPRPPMRFTVPLPGDVEGKRFFDLSPDGQYLAFVGARTTDSRELVWVHSFRTLETRPLPGTEGERSLPFWSPDARSIGFFADGKLKRIDVASGVVRVVCDAPNGRGGAWGSDGTILFTPDTESPLYRVPADGGSAPVTVTRLGVSPGELSHRLPSLLPDGRHFVFTVLGARGWYGLALGSTDAGPQTMLMTWQADARSPYGSTQAYVSDGRLLFVRDGVLFAQHLDVERRRLTGEAAPLASNVFETDLGREAFAVSRAGLLVYLPLPQSAQPRQLTLITRSGSRTRTLWDPGAMFGLSLAPDGRRAAVERADPQTGASEVWLLDIERGTSSRLTSGRDAYGAIWSADGARVVFASASSLANVDIYAQAADGSGREERIVESPAGSAKIPLGWSTSGGLLFSASNRAGGFDLWTLAAGSGERPALLFNGEQRAQFQDATVSRDGRFVAFGPTGEIYLQTLPRGPRVLVAADGAYRARWRDDGRELYYIANGKLMAVTVRLRAGIELGAPETLFDIPANVPPWSLAYAPLGDGQHFLFELPVSTKPPAPLTAMLNWAAATASPH